MGGVCSGGTQADQAEDSQVQEQKYTKPAAINEILGVDVVREHALFQYALFCTTRMVENYRATMFPSIGATCLDNFKNHVEDFRAVIKEVYHDMSFDERTIANSRGYVEDDRLAKEAISELAYMLVNIHRDLNSHSENYIAGTTEKLDIFMTQTSPAPEEVVKQYEADSMYLASDRQFETCYEDTLKMLVADLERQDIWEPQSIYSQKAFQNYLKQKEPLTFQGLYRNSIQAAIAEQVDTREQ